MKKLLLLLLFIPNLVTSQTIYFDLSRMDKQDLKIARNTVFAKYGREFQSKDLRDYFTSTLWYKINPNYSDDMLSEEDIKLVNIIRVWESSELIWSKKFDMDNDNLIDACFLLKELNAENFFLLINNEMVTINNTHVNSFDNSKEYLEVYPNRLHVATDRDWGSYNRYITYGKLSSKQQVHVLDGKVPVLYILQQSEMSVNDIGHIDTYDGGVVNHLFFTYFNKNIAMSKVNDANFSFFGSFFLFHSGFCRDVHKYYYELENGKLVLEKEVKFYLSEDHYNLAEIMQLNVPWHPCAACFVAESKVLKKENNSISISDLMVGDTIIGYDLVSKEYTTDVVLEMAKFSHENLVELYFNHDTIVSTTDHPYYVFDKGWSSFAPRNTEYNYINYSNIDQIEVGDLFMLSDKKNFISEELNQEKFPKLKKIASKNF